MQVQSVRKFSADHYQMRVGFPTDLVAEVGAAAMSWCRVGDKFSEGISLCIPPEEWSSMLRYHVAHASWRNKVARESPKWVSIGTEESLFRAACRGAHSALACGCCWRVSVSDVVFMFSVESNFRL